MNYLLFVRPAVISPVAEHHRQMHICVNNLPRVALGSAAAGIRTRDLLIASPALVELEE